MTKISMIKTIITFWAYLLSATAIESPSGRPGDFLVSEGSFLKQKEEADLSEKLSKASLTPSRRVSEDLPRPPAQVPTPRKRRNTFNAIPLKLDLSAVHEQKKECAVPPRSPEEDCKTITSKINKDGSIDVESFVAALISNKFSQLALDFDGTILPLKGADIFPTAKSLMLAAAKSGIQLHIASFKSQKAFAEQVPCKWKSESGLVVKFMDECKCLEGSSDGPLKIAETLDSFKPLGVAMAGRPIRIAAWSNDNKTGKLGHLKALLEDAKEDKGTVLFLDDDPSNVISAKKDGYCALLVSQKDEDIILTTG